MFEPSPRALRATPFPTEVDSFCSLQAVMDGFRVMPMEEASKIGDVFITVTGNKHVIRIEHMKQMKDGVILANSGHFDAEIDVPSLKQSSSSQRRVRPLFDEYMLDGKHIFLTGEGRLVNLACAEGHPSEVMSLSFCGQALACEYLVKNKGKLENKVYTLPPEIDDTISRMQLVAMDIKIDALTEEQKAYLGDWRMGT